MIKVALLGTGAIADSHIQAYLKFSDQCQLVAVADLYPDKAEAKAAQHGLDVTVCQDHEQMVKEVEFDLASVCLPPFAHAAATVALLQAGKHVLVEKPMATCLEECDAMNAAARENQKVLSVVAQNRFKTPMMKLKRVLEAGLIGKVLHAQVDSLWWRGGNYYDLWWRGTWEKEGGGCTMNHAVHHIDLFQWMMGLPREVQAMTANLNHGNSEVEDFATAWLSYRDGRIGQITASLVHHGEEQQMVFQGEHARISVPWRVAASRQKENGFPEDDPERTARIQAFYDQLPALDHEGHAGQIANVLAAIDGREELLVDGTQGRQTIELISAIYQSGPFSQRVPLPLQRTDAFYTREGIRKNARHFHEKTKSVEHFAQNEITLGRDVGK